MKDNCSIFYLKLKDDCRLVTVNVLYYLPEYKNIIQEFIWQTNDRVPELVRVHKFLDHWDKNIEATIHEVRISCSNPLSTTDFKHVNYEFPVFWS
jgi:uncharacterized protein Usg